MNTLYTALSRVRDQKEKDQRDALPADLTLEQLVSDRDLGALPISAPQRALCRAADGLPVTHLDAASLFKHFGVTDGKFAPPRRPRVVIVRSGRRSGKSLIAAFAALLFCALFCQLRRDALPGEIAGPDGKIGVRPGELVRGVVVTPRKQQSRAAFRHLISSMRGSPRLSRYLVKAGTESAVIRRDDGADVTIEILAASPSGTNLRSSWFVGAIFDEGDFFNERDAKINLQQQIEAVRPALVEGGQIWVPSSPWEDSGPYHEMFSEAFGNPGLVLAFHSDSFSMNPELEHGERRAEIEELRRRDPDFVAREYDAVPMATGATGFFPEAAIAASFTRKEPFNLEPNGQPHWAGSDLGLSKNSSALALSRHRDGKAVLAYTEERIPTKEEPLKPSDVCTSFGWTCLKYKAAILRGDNFYAATARHELESVSNDRGDYVAYDEFTPTPDAMMAAFQELRRRMLEGLVEGPADPRLVQQMKDTKTRKGASGKLAIALPKHGAAHGDLLMAVVLSLVQVPLDLESDDDRPVAGGRRRW